MAGDNDNVTELEGQVSDLEAQVAELSKKLEAKAAGDNDAALTELTTTVDELSKSLEATLEAKETLEKELAIEKAMSPEDREYCSGMDDDERKAFSSKSREDKDKVMKMAKANDEQITVEGQVIHKSVVGSTSFAILKAQAERIEKNERDIASEREAREMAELKKRADDEYPHVLGTTEERAEMLKAISKMKEPLRKSFEKVFEQSEKLSKAGFDKLGGGGGKEKDTISKSAQDFETKISEIKKRDNVTNENALRKARKEHPELFKAYQAEQN